MAGCCCGFQLREGTNAAEAAEQRKLRLFNFRMLIGFVTCHSVTVAGLSSHTVRIVSMVVADFRAAMCVVAAFLHLCRTENT